MSKIRDYVRKERQIKLISTPKGESPGQFTFNGISGSETVVSVNANLILSVFLRNNIES